MDRGAAFSCKIIYNWDEKSLKKKNIDNESDSDSEKIIGDYN